MKKTLLVLVALLIVLLASCTTVAGVKAEAKAEVEVSADAKIGTFTITGFSKYGHCFSDLSNAELKALGLSEGKMAIVTLNGKTFEAKVGKRYDDVKEGDPIVKMSDKYDVAFCINYGNMAEFCGGVQEGATGTIQAK